MYGDSPNLYLSRKYLKVRDAIAKDAKIGLDYLQKSRGSSVVQSAALKRQASGVRFTPTAPDRKS